MDERRSNDGEHNSFWGGAAQPIPMPATQERLEVADGSGLRELVERQPVFVMAATLLFAVGALCLVIGVFLLG